MRSIRNMYLADPPTPPEYEFMMLEESVLISNMATYGDACMQFGYMSFFIISLPGASLLVFLQVDLFQEVD